MHFTIDRVIPGATFNRVVTRTTCKSIGSIVSGNRVVAICAIDVATVGVCHNGIVTGAASDAGFSDRNIGEGLAAVFELIVFSNVGY